MVYSKCGYLTRLGHVLLMLLNDSEQIYFPKTRKDMLAGEYSEEWKLLIRMDCVDFIEGIYGSDTCCLLLEAYRYANCLSAADKRKCKFNFNNCNPTLRHYKNMQIIGALNYMYYDLLQ